MAATVSQQHRRQFVEEGYFILEQAIPDEHLAILRNACDQLIEMMHWEQRRGPASTKKKAKRLSRLIRRQGLMNLQSRLI